MKRDSFTGLFLIFLLLVLINGIGCSAAKSVYRIGTDTVKSVTNKIKPGEKPVLRKRVMVTPVIAQAGIGEEKVAQLTDSMINYLKEDDHLLISMSTEPAPSRKKIRSPQFGVVIDPELIKKAEDKGMDVLITSILNPFEVTYEKSGIWPLRKIRRKIEISMAVNAIDINNGTLFLTTLKTKVIKTKEEVLEDQEDIWEIDYHILDKALSPILKDQAAAVLDALIKQPWAGRIVSVDNEIIRINGGKDIGVSEGNIFEVFGKGESIHSVSGKDYYLLGPKVGELKAEKVMQDHSSAVPLNGEKFAVGQVIIIKR